MVRRLEWLKAAVQHLFEFEKLSGWRDTEPLAWEFLFPDCLISDIVSADGIPFNEDWI